MGTKVLVTGGSGFIGEHLIRHLLGLGYGVVNVDEAAPKATAPKADWLKCTIMDEADLHLAFKSSRPDYIIHLAACANMTGKTLDDYAANTVGMSNVLAACNACDSVRHIVVTSTQHVRKPGSPRPKSDTDYDPYMLYGQSKVLTETITRGYGLRCGWTIVRPTAVWGPGHNELADGLWRLISKRRYIHPSKDPVIRSYGYVKNVVWQMERILTVDQRTVDQKVFYVADCNMRQIEWINAFSRHLTGRDVYTVPASLIGLLAKYGDLVKAVGFRFPIYTSRYRNLITPNPVPVETTLELLGVPPITLEQGIKETAAWLGER
jgi:GlcNAc-P-P-Und epimerase